jgi:protein-tyrosine phosphatase
VIRVLWLCAGNICRSPCFAAALRAEADRRGAGHLVESVSAGVAAWCGGRPPHRDMVAAAAAAGLAIAPGRSRRLTAELLGGADVVIPLDTAVRGALLRDFGPATRTRLVRPSELGLPGDDVPDPYGREPAVFAVVVAQARTAAGALLAVTA